MSTPWFRLLVLGALFLLVQPVLQSQEDQVVKKQFTLLKSSKLYLKGTSNVNKFTCKCEDRFPQQTISVDQSDGRHAKFQGARLRMITKKFNCQNGKIDRDMYKALKADEFKYISIELTEVWYNPEHLKNGGGGWFDVKAKVKLTITDVTKEQYIQAEAHKTQENQFSLRGEKSLKMSEYGIDPPEALFGLIKVDDLITFFFELDIALEDLAE